MKHITSYRHFQPIAPGARIIFLMFVSAVTGIRFAPIQRYYNARRASWIEHAASIQNELNRQRVNGFGFRAIDGKRVDR